MKIFGHPASTRDSTLGSLKINISRTLVFLNVNYDENFHIFLEFFEDKITFRTLAHSHFGVRYLKKRYVNNFRLNKYSFCGDL